MADIPPMFSRNHTSVSAAGNSKIVGACQIKIPISCDPHPLDLIYIGIGSLTVVFSFLESFKSAGMQASFITSLQACAKLQS